MRRQFFSPERRNNMLMNVNAMVSQFHCGIPFGDVSAISRLGLRSKNVRDDQRGRLMPYAVKTCQNG
jgi:hypothetical protein